MIRRCCSDTERAWLATLPARERPGAFLGLWTKKEAVAKAVGLGLVLSFSTLEVSGPDPIVAGDEGPLLAAHDVEVTGAVAAVAASPGTVVRHHPDCRP